MDGEGCVGMGMGVVLVELLPVRGRTNSSQPDARTS